MLHNPGLIHSHFKNVKVIQFSGTDQKQGHTQAQRLHKYLIALKKLDLSTEDCPLYLLLLSLNIEIRKKKTANPKEKITVFTPAHSLCTTAKKPLENAVLATPIK